MNSCAIAFARPEPQSVNESRVPDVPQPRRVQSIAPRPAAAPEPPPPRA
jgi:hypothetical protein